MKFDFLTIMDASIYLIDLLRILFEYIGHDYIKLILNPICLEWVPIWQPPAIFPLFEAWFFSLNLRMSRQMRLIGGGMMVSKMMVSKHAL